MAVPYLLYKNKKAGKPSVYCRVQHHETMTFDDLCQRTSDVVKLVSKDTVRSIIQAAIEQAYWYIKIGYRVEIGDQCLSLYPQVKKAVPAKIDPATGEIIWPKSEDVVPDREDGRLECEVHKSFNKRFRRDVHWERAKYKKNRPSRKRKY